MDIIYMRYITACVALVFIICIYIMSIICNCGHYKYHHHGEYEHEACRVYDCGCLRYQKRGL